MVQRVQGAECRVQGIHARYGTELFRILIKAGNKESAKQKVFRFCKDIPIYFWDFVGREKSNDELSIYIVHICRFLRTEKKTHCRFFRDNRGN